ncbi:MAG TPA: hypothetical protein VGC74_15530, partial [Stenotrophomonas sp.]
SAGDVAVIAVRQRGTARFEESVFGRRVGSRADLLMQQPSELRGGDLAIWETQRCAVPVLGFSLAPDKANGRGSTTWLAAEGVTLFVAGLCSIIEVNDRPRSAFSILATASTQAPHFRPMYLRGGKVTEWLQSSGSEAMGSLRADWSHALTLQARRRGDSPLVERVVAEQALG